jgi:hypothetical protein
MLLLDPAFWFWAPLATGMLPLVPIFFARDRSVIRLLRYLSLACIALAMAATAGWTWLLRDGMGPDSIDSHGTVAWVRFWQMYAGPLLLGTISAAAVVMVCRWGFGLPPATIEWLNCAAVEQQDAADGAGQMERRS